MWDHAGRQRYTDNAIVAVKFSRWVAFQLRKLYLRMLIIFVCVFTFVIALTNFNLRNYFTAHYLNHGNSVKSYIKRSSFISIENYDGKQLQQDKVQMDWMNETLFPLQKITTGSSATLNGIPECPTVSNLLVGWLDLSNWSSVLKNEKEENFERRMRETGVVKGGSYRPTSCRSRHKVAIIVPYRHREDHLVIFLRYMHPFLQRQQLTYTIFVIEQQDSLPFNRGMLMNIGFKEAKSVDHFQCFIFHDVDMLPENDGNLYTCPEVGHPRQMAFTIDIFDYKPTPHSYFGGVNAFSFSDFQRINGFSNLFWGWGGEDDDLFQRLLFQNLTVVRPFEDQPTLIPLARYRTLYHKEAFPNPARGQLIHDGKKRFQTDGLNNVSYRRLDFKFKQLCTHIRVELKQHQRV